MKQLLKISQEVEAAIEAGKPVVALESTIISHGMPYPQNLQTALRVEETVRAGGATPATIGILDGRPTAGLSPDEIERLAKRGLEVTKVSRRDLPFVVARKGEGATTVAATMIIAAMAGIRLFATGGVGGVHRGAPESFDISADLEELAHTDVAVVCAGAKSILDLGLTLEYLETRGVPVIGYRTDELPAFYTRTSGFRLEYRLDSAGEIARALRVKWAMGLHGGVIIANPIPPEHSLEPDLVAAIIDRAVEDAGINGIRGKEITPYLLARIVELTGGRSLEANIELVLNNALLAAQVAAAYTRE